MNCFEHPATPSVGTCKVCNKGVCRKCAVDQGHSLTCAGTCEREAEQLHIQILQNRKSMKTGRATIYLWPLILFFMGVTLLVNEYIRHGIVVNWGSIFGSGIVVIALYMFVIYRKWGMEMQRSESKD